VGAREQYHLGSGRIFLSAIVGIGVSCACAVSFAQQPSQVERFDRQLDQIQRTVRLQVDQSVPMDQRALIDYGAYLSDFFFSIDDSDQHTHLLNEFEAVAFAHVNLDGAHEIFVRGRSDFRQFSHHESFDGNDTDWIGKLDRAYYRFDLNRYLASSNRATMDYDLAFQAGRQLVEWGNGLTLSREIDGGLADFSWGATQVEALAGMTSSQTTDFDTSRPGYQNDTDRAFYGVLLSQQLGTHRPFAYYLVQNDHNDTSSLANFKYNSFYVSAGSTGGLTDHIFYGLEAVFEGCSSHSDKTSAGQTRDSIHAYAADGRLDYLCNDVHDTRLSFETIAATGDSDRATSTSNTLGGNQLGTSDRAFNAFGLLNTGYAFAPDVSNLLEFRLGASTFPFIDSKPLRRLQIGTDLFFFDKFNSNAPINEPTHDNRFLGTEADIYANWQLTSDVSILIRYGIFFPAEAIVADHQPRNFLVVGMTYAF